MQRLHGYYLLLLCVGFFLGSNAQQGSESSPLKVLHLSFHIGCIKDFDVVAHELGLNVTNWFLHSPDLQKSFADVKDEYIYNIGHNRAKLIWDRHKDFFNQFDVIVTSDTAPLSRIFLQNGWQKPLVIWICNRFDYTDLAHLDCHFPDPEYYELFRKAALQSNVKIVGYVAYEHYHTQTKGVNTGSLVIKPVGSLENTVREGTQSIIPASINKQETFFIPPRLEQHQINHLIRKCESLGLKVYCGNYNGPYDLKDFKGIIHFPYAWSNLALFENMQLGIPYFVPSQKFLRELYYSSEHHMYRFFAIDHLELSEWYCPEHKDVITYFDSWTDLRTKISMADFAALKSRSIAFGKVHKETMLNRWKELFLYMQKYLKNVGTN